MPALLQNTKQNLKAASLKMKEVLCNAGYSSTEVLRVIKENKITGYIPNFGQYKSFREGFRYFPGGDYYKCGRGVRLSFKRIKDSHDGAYQMKVYRCSSLDCRHCPLRTTCIGKSDFKKIEDTVDKHLYDEMHQRMQIRKARRMKKLRQAIVEPVIDTLVNFLGMRRVNTRGIKLASKCLLMAAVCYNLKRLLKWTRESKETAEKSLVKLLLKLWPSLVQQVGKCQLAVALNGRIKNTNYRIQISEIRSLVVSCATATNVRQRQVHKETLLLI